MNMKSRRPSSKEMKIENKIEEFGNRAESPKIKKESSRKRTYKPYTFSLSEEYSEFIDELTLTCARITRSDVVKVGIALLKAKSEEELIEIFKNFNK